MGKYNLIDIYEQYQIGSGWTNDFDYDGMLNAGLNVSVDTNIETLKKIVEDFTDVNYHREASHLYDAIEAIEGGDMFEAEGKLNDFFAEIRKTQGSQGMDMSDDLGAYMASKMEEGKKEEEEKKATYDPYGDYEKEEVEEVSSSVGSRIEGLLNIPMKQKFLDAGMDLIQDLLEEDPFFIPDVIDHLSIELEKYYDGFLDQGDRLAGIGEAEDSVEEGYVETKGKALYPILKAGANATGDEIEMYVKSLAKDIELNGKEQYKDFKSEDFVEDFKEYIADKSLQEHFKRFL